MPKINKMKQGDDMIRCAIYDRVSTDRQVTEGLSLETQRADLTKYANEHGYYIVDYYADDKGGEEGQYVLPVEPAHYYIVPYEQHPLKQVVRHAECEKRHGKGYYVGL